MRILCFVLFVNMIIIHSGECQNPGGIAGYRVWDLIIESNERDTDFKVIFNFNKYDIFGLDQVNKMYSIDQLSQITMFMVYHQSGPETFVMYNRSDGDVKISDQSLISRGHIDIKSKLNMTKFITYTENYGIGKHARKDGSFVVGKYFDRNLNETESFLGELVLYDRILSDFEKNKVETYLAVKYGVSMPDSVIYTLSDGQIFIDKLHQSNYKHRVTGILRDDASGLYQRQSKNVNDSLGLTIALGEIYPLNEDNRGHLTNMSGMWWADDNGPLEFEKRKNDREILELKRNWKLSMVGSNKFHLRFRIDVDNIKEFDFNMPTWVVIDKEGKAQYFELKRNEKGSYEGDVDLGDISNQEVFFRIEQAPYLYANFTQSEVQCDENGSWVNFTISSPIKDHIQLDVSNEALKNALGNNPIALPAHGNVYLNYGNYKLNLLYEGQVLDNSSLVIKKELCKNVANKRFKINPNPILTSQKFTIKDIEPLGGAGDYKLLISDNQGQIIFSTSFYDMFTHTIDRSGVYFLELSNNEYKEIHKLIVIE